MNAIGAIEVNKKILQVLFEKQIIIDYDKPVYSINDGRPTCLFSLPSNIKSISEDIAKVKVERTGKWSVSLVLLDAGHKVGHDNVKEIMENQVNVIEPAGLHELFYFSCFLQEIQAEKFSVTALRDEMFERGVEFVPTVYGTKISAHIVADYRDYLPFKKTFFLGVHSSQQI